ncbi:YihY/virulence factor BrkB family protein [Bowmanella dokdonensis]|uniref:YihY/virulence factor BrkB family protein n=1 Tax=Bowmanella dokdonensis TaxID=751969 RepID=A0A939DMN0_9ALTE|nr:YihY/virulence factor BrkB family protein [Bowmanella dokdonensis]MBN7825042.1 YihY/virulence factor BrkB family protein [Bowmanella dokdonensis]
MNKGHKASHPGQIPLAGWWAISRRIFRKMADDRLPLIAAGVAFYFLLALFPLLAAFISLYGLLVDSQQLTQHLDAMVGILPYDSRQLLLEHAGRLVGSSQATLSMGALLSLLFALWSGSRGAQALMSASNITYGEAEDRGWLKGLLMRLALTLGAVVFLVISLSLITWLPLLLESIGLGRIGEQLFSGLTWPFLALIFSLGLSLMYRYAPYRRRAKWRWITPGSAIATLLWLMASAAFSLYVSEFSRYNETYGSLGGIVILLMWLYLSAYIILFGAEFNAATEHQTNQDSTKGPDKPMGERGAYVADTLPDKDS